MWSCCRICTSITRGGLIGEAGISSDRLLFPNAVLVTSRRAWQRAVEPHPRDRASFIPGLCQAISSSYQTVDLVADGGRSDHLPSGYSFHFSDGHTPGLMMCEIPADDGPIVYASDLIPGTHWVHLPITMGYDRFPEKLIDEKRALLDDLVARGGRVFFTHDSEVALAPIDFDGKRLSRQRHSGAGGSNLVAPFPVLTR